MFLDTVQYIWEEYLEEEFNGEILDQEIADARLDELEEVEGFQEVSDVGKFRTSCIWIIWKKCYETVTLFGSRCLEDEINPMIGKERLQDCA